MSRKLLAAGLLVLMSVSTVRAASEILGEIEVSPQISPTDLVVYIATPPPRVKPSKPNIAVIDQHHQAFHPRVLAVVKGTTVRFLNSDRVAHNVFSLSPTKTFDLGKITPNALRSVTFDKTGIVEVLCGFHSRMIAYIRVMDHPYFAVPDGRGKFTIRDLPPGNYQLRIWHESLLEISEEVRVTPEAPVSVLLRFPR